MPSWHLTQLWTGAAAACVVASASALAVAVAGRVDKRARHLWWRRPLPMAGVVFTSAGLWSASLTHRVPDPVTVGVLGCGVAGLLVQRRRFPGWLPFLVTLPAAGLVGLGGELVDVAWVRVLVVAIIAVGAPLAARLDQPRRPPILAVGLLAGAVAGGYLTVPDTEEAVALVGAVAVAGLLTFPVGLMRLGRAGAASSVAVVIWVMATDGRGRPTSIIGATTALGLMVTLPLVRLVATKDRVERHAASSRRWITMLVLAVHAIVVLASARVVGFAARVGPSAVAGGCVALLAVLASIPLSRWLDQAESEASNESGRSPRDTDRAGYRGAFATDWRHRSPRCEQ